MEFWRLVAAHSSNGLLYLSRLCDTKIYAINSENNHTSVYRRYSKFGIWILHWIYFINPTKNFAYLHYFCALSHFKVWWNFEKCNITIDGAIDKVLKFYFLLRTFVYNRYVKNHKTTFILKNIIAIKMIWIYR